MTGRLPTHLSQTLPDVHAQLVFSCDIMYLQSVVESVTGTDSWKRGWETWRESSSGKERQPGGPHPVVGDDDVILIVSQGVSGAVCQTEEGEGLPSHAAPQDRAGEGPASHGG